LPPTTPTSSIDSPFENLAATRWRLVAISSSLAFANDLRQQGFGQILWGYSSPLKPRRRKSVKVLATLSVMGIVGIGALVMSASATAAAHCHGLTATITGTSGPDVIVGTNHHDVIVAGAGNDTVRGRGGRDVICAGRGDDEVKAGERHDRVYGGPDRDDLGGGMGADRLFGQRGRDELFGGSANDTLNGGSGTDEGFGGSGTDMCLSIEFAHGC
jgi:hypothetical protein